MGWPRSEWTIFFKMPTGKTTTLHVHPTWRIIGLQSRLEVVHGQCPPDSASLRFAGSRLDPHVSLSETRVRHESTIQVVIRLRGD